MFKPNEDYGVDEKILNFDFIRYSTAKTSTLNTPNSQIFINIPRKDSRNSLLNYNLELNFEVIKKTDSSRYANGSDMQLVNLGPKVLFSSFKSTTNKGKHLEDISHIHIVSLLYKVISSAKDTNDLS